MTWRRVVEGKGDSRALSISRYRAECPTAKKLGWKHPLGELTGKNETTYEFFKSKDYPYDYITAVRSQKTTKRDEEITYAELAHKEPSCPVVNRLQPATEYAELDFQRRLGAPYPWPSSTHEEALRSSLDAGEFPLISGASRRSKESLHIPETTTETTPL